MSTSSADHYDGPAVLFDADGDEVPVTARLWVEVEPVMIGDELFDRYEPGPRRWRGIVEVQIPLSGRRLPLPATLRFPNDAEGTIGGMSGEGHVPNRVQIEGIGAAPWDWSEREVPQLRDQHRR